VNYRLKLAFFFLSALAILVVLNAGYSALNTLSRLNVVEAARDQWQRPIDVVQALALRQGDLVVDLGCGSGYFTLKLSAQIGKSGRVIAEDIRRLPLAFLWFRALRKNEHNVSIVYDDPIDPHLPPAMVNGVLVSNTYHELTDPHSILTHAWQSLISGGRLVVVDRAPNPSNVGITENGEHEISAEQVELDLRQARFEILSRQDHFIESDPDRETWWLLIARKP
jgi:ubiquinone/menaquinone biosynthesis C-methylase UbiE